MSLRASVLGGLGLRMCKAGDHQPLAVAGCPGRVLPAEISNNQGSWARVFRWLGRFTGLGNRGSTVFGLLKEFGGIEGTKMNLA